MSDPTIFVPHSEKQDRAIFSTKRFLVLGCGTQFGKTRVGALRMKLKMHEFTSSDDNFIITAPTYKIMQQSTLPAFLQIMDGYGKYNKKDDIFTMNNGGTCYMRTETDPDSVVGIPKVRHIWGDEAGKYRLYFWENLQARADSTGCGIDLTTSPYSLNWIYKDLIKPTQQGKRSDVELIAAASWENPYHSLHDPTKRSLVRATMDVRRFNMIYGGEWGRMEGLVYDCWDDEENLVKPFELPPGTKYYGGIDWGYYPDPFALKIRAVTPTGNHFGISEFVKTRLTISDIIKHIHQKQQMWKIEKFFCDPSQPGYIEELNRNKIPAEGADNDIRRGIDLHYELIKTRKYKEFEGTCPHSMSERESYHYPEIKDLGPDDASKELVPVDQANHCFPAGTMIRTVEGQKPIELIKPGDMVETRFGPKKVLVQWSEGVRDTVKIGDLECTPDHKIYTKNRYFIEAASLTKNDELVTWQSWKERQNLTEKFLRYIAAKGILAVEISACMLWFGKQLMVPFQRAIMCTTKTKTHWITESRIWNLLKRPITYQNTSESGYPTQYNERSTDSTLIELDRLQLRGIKVLKAIAGTEIALESFLCLRRVGRLLNNVSSAVKNIRQTISSTLSHCFAVMHARLDRVFSQELTTSTGSVASAAQFLGLTSTQPSAHVESSALTSRLAKPGHKKEVFNFSVEGAFEYFANDVLVSNCMDLDRYLSISLYRSGILHAPKVPTGSKPAKTRLEQLQNSYKRREYEVD